MKKIYFTCMYALLTFALYAQKMPDVQATSMLAPTNVRIDGKANEWGDTFAAENKRTALFYTMANDDKNLYLIIKGVGAQNVNKIMAGGISFTINTEGKKREKEGMTVTYPVINRVQPQRGQGQAGGGGQMGGLRVAGGNMGGMSFGAGQNRPALSQAQRDSMATAQHKTRLSAVKEIKVQGFKSITDSLISIYNEYGVKTVASFDQSGAMIYEIALPLELLGLSVENPKEFVYQLKVNGLTLPGFSGGGGGNRGGGGGGGFVVVGGSAGGGFGGGGGGNFQDMTSPTDFWGKYTPVKK